MACLSIFVFLSAKCSCKRRTSSGCGMIGVPSSDRLGGGRGGGFVVARGRSGEVWDDCCEEIDIGDTSREGLRFGGAGLGGGLFGFVGFCFEASGLSASSSSESLAAVPAGTLSAVSSSSSSSICIMFCRRAGMIGFVFCGCVLSESVVGMRGTLEGR